MVKIIIGTHDNKDDQLAQAVISAQDGDVIELLPGTYFSRESPFICTIRKNISIIGKTDNRQNITLNCSFMIGAKTTVIFKNLTINYPANDENTLSAYDDAKVYGNNILIDHLALDSWDTVYGKNAAYSFKNSKILTGVKTKAVGISLDNSRLFADTTSIQLLFQKNSQAFLRDSTVSHELKLRQNSSLNFRNLTIAPSTNPIKNNLVVKSSSLFMGENLRFTAVNPHVRIYQARFNVKKFYPSLDKIHFKFDSTSKIFLNGKKKN
ncbi:hypothetical protein LCR01_02390 [Companilactobacillus crustorum]|uniref:DUF1565 domain-containing protein n=3 Tax=Companilactobacillus TaxID=2767879 RepID=A0A837RKQ6_9LACO|nr:hypothetical protein [Companilactobacillus crustorum]APU71174.1 hypothetical protein BI355_0854 [Companilactobacillus crustorum]KRK43897.1 hypothetical protein FD26_GL001381 [Companilactobacillus crustorum JCM 15951]KRO21336.1 hypothetical protein IV63_GL001470 [Companilactobacillus crustorum]WDT64589.1 hypothetical protein NV391_06175 [Companilactobacillus crustorum]GEO75796.1 hypothetical protein LCR01_02390 [Companilactobacillus crustorum]